MKQERMSDTQQMPDASVDFPGARWGRRGVIASLLVSLGTLAVTFSRWFYFSPDGGDGYQVIAEWQSGADTKGLMIAIRPHSTRGELRSLGTRLRGRFRAVDDVAVMIFDDATAARQVRKGSRNVDETRFQAALAHQRAMYLKSATRGEESFTIYKSYPAVAEVMRFDDNRQPLPSDHKHSRGGNG